MAGDRLLKLQHWLTGGQFRWLIKLDAPDWTYWPQERLEDLGLRLICLLDEHQPCRDACAKPQHDFCSRCFKPMPGAGGWPTPDEDHPEKSE